MLKIWPKSPKLKSARPGQARPSLVAEKHFKGNHERDMALKIEMEIEILRIFNNRKRACNALIFYFHIY
jgi:hypothetical protein